MMLQRKASSRLARDLNLQYNDPSSWTAPALNHAVFYRVALHQSRLSCLFVAQSHCKAGLRTVKLSINSSLAAPSRHRTRRHWNDAAKLELFDSCMHCAHPTFLSHAMFCRTCRHPLRWFRSRDVGAGQSPNFTCFCFCGFVVQIEVMELALYTPLTPSSWLVQLTYSQFVEPAWSCKRGISLTKVRDWAIKRARYRTLLSAAYRAAVG